VNIKEVQEAVRLIHEHTNVTPILVGHHGKGKSQVIQQIAKEDGVGFIDLRLSTQETGDLLGLPEIIRDHEGTPVATTFMKPNWFPTEGRGILFLDEFNRAKKDVLQSMLQLVLDRQFHTHVLPEGWKIVAACNPETDDYPGLAIDDKALIDRFCYIKFEPTVNEWLSFAESQGASPAILGFIRKQPEMLEGKLEEFSLDFVEPSRRSLLTLAKLHNKIKDNPLFKEIAFGMIGITATAAMMKHIQENEVSISGMELLANYHGNKELIEKLVTNYRMDVLNTAIDEIVAKQDIIIQHHTNNLKPLLLAIPAEVGIKLYNLLENILMEVENEDILSYFNDDDLVNHFAAEAEKTDEPQE